MKRFSAMVLSNGTDKITIKPMVNGRGYRITEPNLAYYHRGGILPQTVEMDFENVEDVEDYIESKKRIGFKQML